MKPTHFPSDDYQTSDSDLDRLVMALTSKIEAGEEIRLSELTADCPEHRGRLEVLLPTLQAIANLEKLGSEPMEGKDVELSVSNIQDGVIGDFRILRELGRGGMGIVYEARQISLSRRVALKVMPFAALLDERRLVRFHNEARAAAMLNHPNIVSVYAVGCDRSVHHYAMELIEGQSLAELISTQHATPNTRHVEIHHESADVETCPLNAFTTSYECDRRAYFRQVTRMGIQAAQALEYAHQQGIIHRDIKPANLLVDSRGDVHISDFGLARIQSDAKLTTTGDVIGTLRYMSPEQAGDGRALLDHRTDIYSLGLTLYEILTRRVAIDGEEPQLVLRQIDKTDPPRPREIDQQIPRDLEAIVWKAISKEPSLRYPTAGRFADDLQRFLDSRSVSAKRPSSADRISSWIRRNPAITWVLLLTLCVMVATLTISTVFVTQAYRRESHAVRQYDQSLQELQEFVQWAIIRPNKDEEAHPRTMKLRREMLQRAVQVYERVLRRQTNQAGLREQTAVTYFSLGSAQVWLGEQQAAHDSMKKAEEIFQTLLVSDPENVVYREYLAEIDQTLAVSPIDRDEHRARVENSIAKWRALATDFPNKPRYLSEVANGHNTLAHLLRVMGRWHEAREHLVQAKQAWQDHADRFPNETPEWGVIADSHMQLGDLLQFQNAFGSAENELLKASEIRERLVAERNGSHFAKGMLAAVHRRLGQLMDHRGRPGEAQGYLEQGLELINQVEHAFPNIPYISWEACLFYQEMGNALELLGHNDLAILKYEEGTHNWASLLKRFGSSKPAFRYEAASNFYYLGVLLHDDGRTEDARSHFIHADQLFKQAYASAPNQQLGIARYIIMLANCPSIELRDEQLAVQLAEAGVVGRDDGLAQQRLTIAYFAARKWNECARSARNAMKLRNGGDIVDWLLFAAAQHHLGETEIARDWSEKAVASGEQAACEVNYFNLRPTEVKMLQREVSEIVDAGPSSTREGV